MFDAGFLLLVAGMGTVFVFLSVMVLCMLMVGAYFKAHASRYGEAEASTAGKVPRAGGELPPMVAAIAIALRQRAGKGKD